MKLNKHNLGLAGGILAALSMILISIANTIGIYKGVAQHMQEMHMFYTTSITGTITEAIEAGIATYIALYAIAFLYNLLEK